MIKRSVTFVRVDKVVDGIKESAAGGQERSTSRGSSAKPAKVPRRFCASGRNEVGY